MSRGDRVGAVFTDRGEVEVDVRRESVDLVVGGDVVGVLSPIGARALAKLITTAAHEAQRRASQKPGTR